MPRRAINKKLYDRLLQAYQTFGANYSAAARASGCGTSMSKRAYEIGWPSKPEFRAIKLVLADRQIFSEKNVSRAEREARIAAAGAREQAVRSALEAHEKEGKLVQLARGGAQVLLANALIMLRASQPLAQEIRDHLLDTNTVRTPAQAVNMLDRLGKFTRDAVGLTDSAMRMERLHQDKPEALIRIESTGEMTREEALKELREAADILAREQGVDPAAVYLEVLEGGKA